MLRPNEESVLFPQNLITTYDVQIVDLMMLILKDGDGEEDGHLPEDDLCGFADNNLVAVQDCGSVCVGCTDVFAEADDEHLLDTAAEVAEEVSVRLDSINDDNGVGLSGGAAEDYGTVVAGVPISSTSMLVSRGT